MWTYKTIRTTTTAGGVFEMTLDTDMTLNSNSMVHKFLIKHYPYGAFNTRHNKLHMLVNKSNWHKLATNAMNGKVTRDVAKGAEVLTTTNEDPYTFELVLPALLTLVKNGMTEVKSPI